MQILGRPGRPGLGAYEPCRDITPPTMIRLPDVRGKLQSSFTVTCSRFRLIIIVFDTSAFSEFPELFVHNACCATSARTRPLQTAVCTFGAQLDGSTPDLVSAPDVQPSFKSTHATRCFHNKYQHLTLEVIHLVDIVRILDVNFLCTAASRGFHIVFA